MTKEIIQDINFFFFFRVHNTVMVKRGTEDLELGEINVLRIDHQFLEERESQTSVCLRFCLCELVLILEIRKPLCCATF